MSEGPAVSNILTTPMIDAARESAILARITKIPIFATLRMEPLSFGSGHCQLRVPRQSMYDGVFESFHGGILMTIGNFATSTAADILRTG